MWVASPTPGGKLRTSYFNNVLLGGGARVRVRFRAQRKFTFIVLHGCLTVLSILLHRCL